MKFLGVAVAGTISTFIVGGTALPVPVENTIGIRALPYSGLENPGFRVPDPIPEGCGMHCPAIGKREPAPEPEPVPEPEPEPESELEMRHFGGGRHGGHGGHGKAKRLAVEGGKLGGLGYRIGGAGDRIGGAGGMELEVGDVRRGIDKRFGMGGMHGGAPGGMGGGMGGMGGGMGGGMHGGPGGFSGHGGMEKRFRGMHGGVPGGMGGGMGGGMHGGPGGFGGHGMEKRFGMGGGMPGGMPGGMGGGMPGGFGGAPGGGFGGFGHGMMKRFSSTMLCAKDLLAGRCCGVCPLPNMIPLWNKTPAPPNSTTVSSSTVEGVAHSEKPSIILSPAASGRWEKFSGVWLGSLFLMLFR